MNSIIYGDVKKSGDDGSLNLKFYFDDTPSNATCSYIMQVFFHEKIDGRMNYDISKIYTIRVFGKIHYRDVVDALERLHNRRSYTVKEISLNQFNELVKKSKSWRNGSKKRSRRKSV